MHLVTVRARVDDLQCTLSYYTYSVRLVQKTKKDLGSTSYDPAAFFFVLFFVFCRDRSLGCCLPNIR